MKHFTALEISTQDLLVEMLCLLDQSVGSRIRSKQENYNSITLTPHLKMICTSPALQILIHRTNVQGKHKYFDRVV